MTLTLAEAAVLPQCGRLPSEQGMTLFDGWCRRPAAGTAAASAASFAKNATVACNTHFTNDIGTLMSAIAPLVGAVAGVAVGGFLMVRSSAQCRKPTDRAGRAVLARMNVSHAAVTQWGLSHVDVGQDCTILDVGCGGGRTID